MEDILLESYYRMISDYGNIFRSYYPAHNSTGFMERNLTFYFCKALIDRLSDGSPMKQPFAWMEPPLPDKNQHMDAFVYSPHAGQETAFFIEAKRFSDVTQKLQEVKDDIGRILNPKNRNHILGTQETPLPCKRQYLVYLADVWIMDGEKEKFPEKWSGNYDGDDENSFVRMVKQMREEVEVKGPCRGVAERLNAEGWVSECLNNYCLLFGFCRID